MVNIMTNFSLKMILCLCLPNIASLVSDLTVELFDIM